MPRLTLAPAGAALLALALAFTAPSARAEPTSGSDAITQMLIDQGLVDAHYVVDQARNVVGAVPALGQQVRDVTTHMVSSAMNFLGVPYKRGGNSSETGFDCSGFTRHIFESSLGLLLPRRVDQQAKSTSLVAVKRDELKPGDLVFFNTLKRTFSHVGIYVGDDKFIHAPHSGAEVRVESLSVKYWAKRFTGARRATAAEAQAAIAQEASGPAMPTPSATDTSVAP